MGYIVALVSVLSFSTFYYKHQYEEAVKFQLEAEEESKRQQAYINLLNQQADRQTEILNEQHQLEVNKLNSDINSLRKQTSRSSLSTIPKSPTNPDEISFDREKLDKAIQEYRSEISKLIGEVSYCQIELQTLSDWIDNQKEIFDGRK